MKSVVDEHEIYKKRGKMNVQIGIVLGVFVILVVLGTMAKLADQDAEAKAVATEEAQQ